MASNQTSRTRHDGEGITRERLIELLNEDLAREYQAVIAYVVYSQVLKGPEFMTIAGELEQHAQEELRHALTIAKQIDYLGGMPTVTPKPVRTSEDARAMLRFDLEAENETVRAYQERVRQCEALGEYGMAQQIRAILVDEQEHQIDLATALGEDVPEATRASGQTSPVHQVHAMERGERLEMGKAIARGGKSEGFVAGASEQSP